MVQCGQNILLALAVLPETMLLGNVQHWRMRMGAWVDFCQRGWEGPDYLEGSYEQRPGAGQLVAGTRTV